MATAASLQGVDLFALLGLPIDADGARVRKVIWQHQQAKLLPDSVLSKASQYLLNDALRPHYIQHLQQRHNPVPTALAQLNLYADLHLSSHASASDIQRALEQQFQHIPMHTWLLARKWLLHPQLRAHYDAHHRLHFAAPRLESTHVFIQNSGVTETHVAQAPTKQTPWFILVAAAMATAVSVVSVQHISQQDIPRFKQSDVLPPVVVALPASQQHTTIDITAVGDTTLGSHLGGVGAGTLPAVWQQENSAYFMQQVADVLGQDDVSIVNLEGPLTQAAGGMSKQFVFKGHPDLAKVLAEGSIEAVNVANNHSHDYGETGFQDTLAALAQHQIPAFGYQNYQIIEVKGKRIALAGAKAWTLEQGKTAVDEALAHFSNQKVDYLVMSFHWGQERQYRQNATQEAIAHYAIDSGFNTVLGHHPHVVQGVERYKQGVIVYSLANFVFGGNSNPSDKDSIAVKLQVDFVGDQVVANDVRVLPLSVSGRSNGNDYRPVWANAATKERVWRKMQAASNVDVRLGWRENVVAHALLASTAASPTHTVWCDDTTSVWAPALGIQNAAYLPKCTHSASKAMSWG